MECSEDETAKINRLSRNKKSMQAVKSTDCSNEEEEEANWEIQSVSCEVIEGKWSVEIDL